jgi:hypothetical protein
MKAQLITFPLATSQELIREHVFDSGLVVYHY